MVISLIVKTLWAPHGRRAAAICWRPLATVHMRRLPNAQLSPTDASEVQCQLPLKSMPAAHAGRASPDRLGAADFRHLGQFLIGVRAFSGAVSGDCIGREPPALHC